MNETLVHFWPCESGDENWWVTCGLHWAAVQNIGDETTNNPKDVTCLECIEFMRACSPIR